MNRAEVSMDEWILLNLNVYKHLLLALVQSVATQIIAKGQIRNISPLNNQNVYKHWQSSKVFSPGVNS